MLRQVAGVDQRSGGHPPGRQRVHDPVGQQPALEVDRGERDQGGDERELEQQVLVGAAYGHHGGRCERNEQH